MRTFFTLILMAVCAISNAQGLQKMNPNKHVFNLTENQKRNALPVKAVTATPKVVEKANAKKAAMKKVAKGPKKTAYAQGPVVCDSVVYYGSEGITGKTIYFYENGVETYEISYEMQDGEMVPTYKDEVAFDQYDNVISDASYYWEDGAWKPSSKSEETFDANGNETSYKYYDVTEDGSWLMTYKDATTIDEYGYTSGYESYWLDTETNIWMGSDKWVQTNTSVEGHFTYSMHWDWDWDNNVWVNSYKIEAEYTGNDNVELNYAVSFWEDGAWVGTYKEEFTYNDDYNFLSLIYYEWGDGDWTYQTKYEFDYDADGNQILQANYDYTDGEWVPNFKEEYVFDSHGNLTSDISHFGNSETKDWELYTTFTYDNTYDENDRLASSIMYTIDGETVYNSSKEDWTYNEDGKVLTDISSTWNDDTNEWEYGMKYEYAYDKNGRQTLNSTWYYYEGWYGSIKGEYTFDDNGNYLSDATYDWDWSTDDWAGWSKNVYTYDEAGNQTSRKTYTWASGEWVAESKEEFTFNERGEITEDVNYTREDGEWLPTTKYVKGYDEYGNYLGEADYEYQDDEWVLTWQEVYFYSSKEEVGTGIATAKSSAAQRNKVLVDGKLVIIDAEGRQFNAAGKQMK